MENAARMESHDTSQGSSWSAQPTEDWNDPAYWVNHYRELLVESRSLGARPDDSSPTS